ncbi:MAG: NAD-glutamate dehydrogenase [Magnetospiraceae bacterium]
MDETAKRRRAKVVDPIIAMVKDKLGAKRAAMPSTFIQQFYSTVAPEDLETMPPESLFGAGLSLWRFFGQRSPGEPQIRVHNPTVEEHGWQSDHTVVEVINDDMPFLVDSVNAALTSLDLGVYMIIHPVLAVRRTEKGKLKEILGEDADAPGESVLHFQITAQSGEARLAEIENKIRAVLTDVRAAVDDWPEMCDKLTAVIDTFKAPTELMDKPTVAEVKEFLQWVLDDHFTLLGYRQHSFKGHKDAVGPGLGILRNPDVIVFREIRELEDMPAEVQEFVDHGDPMVVTKANVRSTVHRPVHLDVISVKWFNKTGHAEGMHMFVGLFTSVAYGLRPDDIPYLRQKVQKCLNRSGFQLNGYDGKTLAHIVNTLPRDELLQLDDDGLYRLAMGVLMVTERKRTGLFIRRDRFERYFSILVYVPRDRYNSETRRRIEAVLEPALNGTLSQHYTLMDDSPMARVHLIIRTEPGNIPDVDEDDLQNQVIAVTRGWEDTLREALLHANGEEKGQTLFRRYQHGFPFGYQDRFTAPTAVRDIDRIEWTLGAAVPGMSLYRPVEAADHEVRFKIYHRDTPILLSDILPMLEDMGLKVDDELPYRVRPAQAASEVVFIHDFGLESADGRAIDLGDVRDLFQDAFLKVWIGEAESDDFNKLVIGAGLTWREVVLLRAFAKYLKQATFTFSQDYIADSLFQNGPITRKLVDLFALTFDPKAPKSAEKKAEKLRQSIIDDLDQVVSADQDRILRRYLNLIDATLRTNYYQPAADGDVRAYTSFKFDSGIVEELPLPRPWREIFVYSPRIEGVHLRGGPVARGGLRWSDRPEDFRTEILGLVKAQQVKNAVIVPVGSKGGFVMKRPPKEGGREAFMAEGIACYKTFIRGLLDITDNLNANDVIPPDSVVRLDGDDPYLVVAADKGTATFSDIANAVAAEYGFWLGDAFASGGSNGYDHKKMGITARGAWESVKRHFREMGIDTQSQEFTVAGVGDMGGDVFGNGMLLSKHIRLIAAFNHLHIFIDPNPDAATTFKERERLFNEVKGWDNYNTDLISQGGGVFSRAAKTIPVSKEMAALFGIEGKTVTPNALMRAILSAQVDMIWFGGIGTYVKASSESDAQVGDRANDSIRVTAPELRCKVVGEGANLGVTHRARIEFALAGGRVNADSIDNSGGVDCSDHEVNIKILLDSVVRNGDMTEKQRNNLLSKMTDEVGDLVLRNNYLQTLAITMVQHHGVAVLDNQARLMRMLERAGRLNRAVEFLPSEDVILERAQARQGLTRPEISVLMPYSKIWLFDQLMDSNLPDDPTLFEELVRYFPTPIQDKYRDQIATHRLRREIIATMATNSLINRAGGTFVMQIMDETGVTPAEVALAYSIARDVFAVREVWQEIETLDNKVEAGVQTAMYTEVNRLLERGTLWFLRHGQKPLSFGANMETFAADARRLMDNLTLVMRDDAMENLKSQAQVLVDQGVPTALARRVAGLIYQVTVCDIVRIAQAGGQDMLDVARLYFAIAPRFQLGWLRAATEKLEADNHWQKIAVAALLDDFYSHHSHLTRQVFTSQGCGVSGDIPANPEAVDAVIDAWTALNPGAINQAVQLVEELKTADHLDYAMLAVASRQLRGLYENAGTGEPGS